MEIRGNYLDANGHFRCQNEAQPMEYITTCSSVQVEWLLTTERPVRSSDTRVGFAAVQADYRAIFPAEEGSPQRALITWFEPRKYHYNSLWSTPIFIPVTFSKPPTCRPVLTCLFNTYHSVRKVSDLIHFCKNLVDLNKAHLHEVPLNLHTHA